MGHSFQHAQRFDIHIGPGIFLCKLNFSSIYVDVLEKIFTKSNYDITVLYWDHLMECYKYATGS